MASRRAILIEALDAWRDAGEIDAPTHERLTRRAMEVPGGEPAAAAPEAERAPAKVGRGFGSDATQFVGGLLLGAGLVALVVFLDADEGTSRWLLLGVGLAVLLGAVALHLSEGERRRSLVHAAFAVGFVPLGVGVTQEMYQSESALPALIGFAAAVGVSALLQGRGPATFLATACGSLASLAAVIELFDGVEATAALLWLVLLLGYLALTLFWRREPWSAASAGALVIPMSIAFIMLMIEGVDRADSVVVELALGGFLGALVGVGIWLGVRALVASAAAALTIDAVVFGFDVGGPGSAVVILLALGGLLVWQGRGIRDYLRRAPPS